MKVVVQAGGEGRRMRPLSVDVPKSLLPVCGKPLLAHMEDRLWREGVLQAELTAGVAATALRDFAACDARRVAWSVTEEPTARGEAGCLAHHAGDELLVLAGDLMGTLPLQELLAAHRCRKAAATVAVRADKMGTMAVATDGAVSAVDCPAGFSEWRYAGAVVLSGEATAQLCEGERLDMTAFFQRLINKGLPVFAVSTKGVFDVDTPEDYRRAVRWVLKETADVNGIPRFIGQGVELGEGAVIGAYCAVGDGVRVGAGARLSGCVIGNGAVIGDGARLCDALVGDRSKLGERVQLDRDGVVGSGAKVLDGVTLTAGVRIFPGRTIGKSCVRPAPLRWDDSEHAVFEVPLRELTASRLATVGVALGNEQKRAPVLLCAEGCAAGVLKEALLAGLCESGCDVQDGGETFLAETAYLTAELPVAWGIHLSERGVQLLDDAGRELPRTIWQAVERRLAPENVQRQEPYAWGKPQSAALFRGSYRDRLLEQAAGLRPMALTLCGDRMAGQRLWEVLELSGYRIGDELRLRLSDGGRRLAVFTPETGYLDADRVEVLLALADDVPTPRPDGLVSVLRLLRYLSETGETVAALNARLPAAVTVCRTAAVGPDTMAALRRLEGVELDSEGVRLARPEGRITVRPAARGRLLSVLAQAVSTEAAQELCDGVIARLGAIPLE